MLLIVLFQLPDSLFSFICYRIFKFYFHQITGDYSFVVSHRSEIEKRVFKKLMTNSVWAE